MSRDLLSKVHKSISLWLFSLLFMIFIIVLLGGSTRLSGSGLSMANINVFKGVIPPMSDVDWGVVFSEYKSTVEYKLTYSSDMTLEEFKGIFWLEYLHRLFARVLAGFVFFFPFLYFLIRYYFLKRVVNLSLVLQLVFMFLLGALQGLVGWVMVKSGLSEQSAYIEGSSVHVSPYRLSIHLSLAFLIYVYILWVGLKIYPFRFHSSDLAKKLEGSNFLSKSFILSVFITILLGIVIVSGSFVAGTKAGMVSKTFPLMLGNFNGYFIPPGLLTEVPWYINIFENKLLVQLNHRLLAYISFILIIFLWYYLGKGSFLRSYLRHTLLFLVLLQVTFGVITLLTFVPKTGTTIVIGTLHQGMAFILFTVSFFMAYRLSVLHGRKRFN